jgi:hypothetical protein
VTITAGTPTAVGGPASTTSLTVNLPTTVTTDGILLMRISNVNLGTAAASIPTPTGWNAVDTQNCGAGNAGHVLFWKPADASDSGGSVTVSNPSAGSCRWKVVQLLGIDRTTPFGHVLGGAMGSNATSFTTGALTITGTNPSGKKYLLAFVQSSGGFFTHSAESANGFTSQSLTEIEDTQGALLAFLSASTSTGTSTFSDTQSSSVRASWTLMDLVEASTGQTVTLGLATQSSTAQPVSRIKVRTTGLATQSSTAQPVSRIKVRTTGLAIQTTSAPAVARAKQRTLGLATETAAAPAVARAKLRLLGGLASEVDTAPASTRQKARPLGLASEVDTALPLGTARAVLVGLVTDVAIAWPLGGLKRRLVALATESTVAPGLRSTKSRAVGLPAETSATSPVARRKTRTLPLVDTVSTALGVLRRKLRDLGLATESTEALPVARGSGVARPAVGHLSPRIDASGVVLAPSDVRGTVTVRSDAVGRVSTR